MEILEIKNLTLSLGGKKILNRLNMNFQRGRVYAVVGPNGAGKSTFAYTVMGLDGYQNIGGDIIFRGESIKKMTVSQRAKKGITLGWQEPARYDGLLVKEFISLSFPKKSEKMAKLFLSKVGLNPDIYMNRAIDRTLSGGERKRIELASIMAMKPKLVMLDEVDSGIDISSFDNIFNNIKLLKKLGSTVILITHSLKVMRQAEHGFLLCGGQLITEGSINKIYRYFKNECLGCKYKNRPEKKLKIEKN